MNFHNLFHIPIPKECLFQSKVAQSQYNMIYHRLYVRTHLRMRYVSKLIIKYIFSKTIEILNSATCKQLAKNYDF